MREEGERRRRKKGEGGGREKKRRREGRNEEGGESFEIEEVIKDSSVKLDFCKTNVQTTVLCKIHCQLSKVIQ